MQQVLSIRHNNNTGRWVVPFRPAWSPAADAVLVGDMKRGVALFSASTGASWGMLAAEALTAIPSRLALHPDGSVHCLAAATSGGRVHIRCASGGDAWGLQWRPFASQQAGNG